jgi:hypothetical protein
MDKLENILIASAFVCIIAIGIICGYSYAKYNDCNAVWVMENNVTCSEVVRIGSLFGRSDLEFSKCSDNKFYRNPSVYSGYCK